MLGSVLASAWRAGSLRLVSVNVLFVAPAQAFTVPEVGKRQLNEINRIRYELELMAVALAVENLTMQKKRCYVVPAIQPINKIRPANTGLKDNYSNRHAIFMPTP